ncbi:MAG: DUF2207 domain-containing protein [Atopobiaceae bacterium]|jgi:uncharacterized membrane protein|nr:DUF2207 domain-containing protein [Atopobiaceae bacterium]
MIKARIGLSRLAVACLALVVALFVAPATQAFARSYSIDEVSIDATVSSDGALSVTEDRTFDFDGSFRGVYWDIPTTGYSGRTVSVDVSEVGQVSGGSLSPFVASSSEQSGSYQVSSATSDSGASVQRIKLYSTQSDSKATFRISYTLTGGVSAWADTGELYWKFVSDGWEVPSDNVTCTIHLPGTATTSSSDSTILAWAHGPLNGNVTRTADGAAYVVPEVGTGEYAEARLTFPVSWLSGMTPSATARLDSIKSEEQAEADSANAKRTAAKTEVYGGAAGIGALGVLSLLKLFRTRRRYRDNHRPVFTDEYFRDVPSNDHPAVLGGLMRDGTIEPQDFTASLMRLTDEKAIKLDVVEVSHKTLFGSKQDKDYCLTRVPSVADKLTDAIDRQTMHFLFDVVAPLTSDYQHHADGRDTLLFSDVSAVAKEHAETYSDSMDAWKTKVTAACESRGFFADPTKSGKGGLMALAAADVLVGFGGGFVCLVSLGSDLGLLVGVVVGVIGIALIAAINKMDSLSAEGVELRAKMRALKKWLCEFTRLKEAVPQDVVLWNKLLVLAVVLGVADQVIKQLKVAMPELLENEEFMPTYGWYTGYYGMPMPADTFTQTFNTAAQVSAAQLASSTMSSGGGFGGGFSGGGGGGFGGGGGGGAF